MTVDVKSLSAYKVDEDGSGVSLQMIDETGTPITLRLSVDQLGMLAMTLPGLIETALRRRYRDTSLRYSYPIGSWLVEQASDPASLIVTLRTPDEFGISFSVPRHRAERLSKDMTAHAICVPEIVSH